MVIERGLLYLRAENARENCHRSEKILIGLTVSRAGLTANNLPYKHMHLGVAARRRPCYRAAFQRGNSPDAERGRPVFRRRQSTRMSAPGWGEPERPHQERQGVLLRDQEVSSCPSTQPSAFRYPRIQASKPTEGGSPCRSPAHRKSTCSRTHLSAWCDRRHARRPGDCRRWRDSSYTSGFGKVERISMTSL